MRKILILSILIIIVRPAVSEGGVTAVIQKENLIDLSPYLEVLKGESRGMNPERFLSAETDIRFSPLQKGRLLLKPEEERWIRFSIMADEEKELYLNLNNPGLQNADFYSPSEKGYSLISPGTLRPAGDRFVNHRTFLFRIILDANSVKTYYIRLKSSSFLAVPVLVRTEESFARHNNLQGMLYGASYGALAALIILSFIIFIVIRDRLFLKFALVTVIMLPALIILSGHHLTAAEWGAERSPAALTVMISFFIIAASLFTADFIGTAISMKKSHRIFRSLMILPLLPAAAAAAGMSRTSSVLIYSIFALYILLSVQAAVSSAAKGQRPAAWLLGALALLSFSLLSRIFVQHGIPDSAWDTSLTVCAASAAGSIILFIALTDRAVVLRTKKEYLPSETGRYMDKDLGDSLTGLGTRNYFEQALRWEVKRAVINETSLSIILINTDNLTKINKSWGRDLGDRILMDMGRTISSLSRKNDSSCRIEDDRFALILPGTNAEKAAAVADRIRMSIYRKTFNIDKMEVRVTISAGVASLKQGEDGRLLFARAEKAIRKAKSEGRNRVSLER